TYTPPSGYTGSDSFTYHASDGSATSSATVTITVNAAVNTPPVATADSYNAIEDTPLVISTAATGVLANDTDVDGDTLTATVATNPTHGTLALTAHGSFTYTPAANYTGADSFTYTASDGHSGSATATVSLTIAAVNDAPVAVADSYNAIED